MFPTSDLTIAALTDPGRKRRTEPNQDRVLVVPADPGRGLPALMIVADGMGGHAGGAVASQTVVEAVAARYRQSGSPSDLPALLNDCLQAAYAAVCARASREPALESMGSTAVLAVVQAGQATVANVGDSRAYRVHANGLTQLSFDHSVVGDQVRGGLITALQARSHPKRNRLTQSISPRRPEIKPFVAQSEFAPGDKLILCTDGLWGVVPEAILQVVAADLAPQVAAEKLIGLANSSGGPDNISVIVAGPASPARPARGEDDTNPGF